MRVEVQAQSWPMREPFEISREVITSTETILVTLADDQGHRGRGEGCGVSYAGETPASMSAQIEAVRPALERGVDRTDLLELLPAGGARNAVDAALWDLEAKRTGVSPFALAGLGEPKPLTTALTIGIRSPAEYEAFARAHADYALLKVKVAAADPIQAIEAVRRGAPRSRLIVDPNQAWSVEALREYTPRLVELGVVLLEQPIKVGDEAGLDGYHSAIPLCADELINEIGDLDKARSRFSVINIKLDKVGGLTNGLALADAARAMGFELMVGCMAGSSLSMAPATVLGQLCAYVDLDGPLLQANDMPNGLRYTNGEITPPRPDFWG